MLRKPRITIKDVAKSAGVSTQTVSRVINNRPDVSPETFQRVQQVIDDTGFSPNDLARSLIRGRSQTLGVVAYGLDYFGPSRVLTGIEHQAVEMGYSILLNLLPRPETNDVATVLESLFARQVDGIIWAIPEIGSNRAWARLENPDFPIPIVFVGGMESPVSLPLAGIDNRAIGRLATEHLLDGGARRIGIVTGPSSWWEARERKQGWCEALEARGLPAEERLVAVGDWSARSGEQGLYQLLVQCPDIDAVFASNDQMGLGVLHVAQRLGRQMPESLSVVGVDNMPESAHFYPPLTSVRQRLREAGALVVRELDRTIHRAKRDQRNSVAAGARVALLRPELVVRDSSRTPVNGRL